MMTGAAARNSIGLVLVVVFVVPSIYMLVAKDHGRDRERLTYIRNG